MLFPTVLDAAERFKIKPRLTPGRKDCHMNNQTIVILDFGGQYKELIARRVRECGVYSVILPYDTDVAEISKMKPIGIIFTGGPNSVYAEDAPNAVRTSSSWAFPCSASATECSLSATYSAEQWEAAMPASTARLTQRLIPHPSFIISLPQISPCL